MHTLPCLYIGYSFLSIYPLPVCANFSCHVQSSLLMYTLPCSCTIYLLVQVLPCSCMLFLCELFSAYALFSVYGYSSLCFYIISYLCILSFPSSYHPSPKGQVSSSRVEFPEVRKCGHSYIVSYWQLGYAYGNRL